MLTNINKYVSNKIINKCMNGIMNKQIVDNQWIEKPMSLSNKATSLIRTIWMNNRLMNILVVFDEQMSNS